MSLAEKKSSPETTKLPERIAIDDIDWEAVGGNLESKYRVKPSRAAKLIDAFKQLMRAPFEISWFQDFELSGEMHMLIAAICDVHNADKITIFAKRDLNLLITDLSFTSEVEFLPNPHGVGVGVLKPHISLVLFGKALLMRDLVQIASARLLMLAAAIIGYVLVVGAILYTLAVWFVFEQYPKETLVDAMSNPATGLALIAAFVLIAGFLGKAISILVGKIVGLMQRE